MKDHSTGIVVYIILVVSSIAIIIEGIRTADGGMAFMGVIILAVCIIPVYVTWLHEPKLGGAYRDPKDTNITEPARLNQDVINEIEYKILNEKENLRNDSFYKKCSRDLLVSREREIEREQYTRLRNVNIDTEKCLPLKESVELVEKLLKSCDSCHEKDLHNEYNEKYGRKYENRKTKEVCVLSETQAKEFRELIALLELKRNLTNCHVSYREPFVASCGATKEDCETLINKLIHKKDDAKEKDKDIVSSFVNEYNEHKSALKAIEEAKRLEKEEAEKSRMDSLRNTFSEKNINNENETYTSVKPLESLVKPINWWGGETVAPELLSLPMSCEWEDEICVTPELQKFKNSIDGENSIYETYEFENFINELCLIAETVSPSTAQEFESAIKNFSQR